MSQIKGFTAQIFRDCFDGGINSINKMDGKKHVTIIDSRMPDMYEPNEEYPPVKIVTRFLFGKYYTHAEPLEPGSYAMGGSFIFTCDSRFREHFPYPVPLHDRQMDMERR